MMVKDLFEKKRKGSGTFLAGTVFCMFCFVFLMLYVFNTMKQQQNYETQMTADAISDGTAIFMSAERSYDYDDAVNQAKEIMNMYQEITNLKLHGISVDAERLLDDREIAITLATERGNSSPSQVGYYPAYTIRSAATSIHMGGIEGIIGEAYRIANDDSIGYNMVATRCMNPNVDCSSFVYYSVLAEFPELKSICPYPFNTAGMDVLMSLGFKRIPYEEAVSEGLKRGDIFCRPRGGEGNGHTEIYIGENMAIGARGDFDGVNGDGSGQEVCVKYFNPANGIGNYVYVYRL